MDAQSEEAKAIGSGIFVRIDVTDDGTGTDAETLEHALDPCFTTKPAGAGRGLGLPQVNSFAKQSGGEDRLQSASGKGTRVSLYLPATAEARATAPAPESPRKAYAGLEVLMVEDDALVSSVVVRPLEIAGHAVTLCGSANDAVQILSRDVQFDERRSWNQASRDGPAHSDWRGRDVHGGRRA